MVYRNLNQNDGVIFNIILYILILALTVNWKIIYTGENSGENIYKCI